MVNSDITPEGIAGTVTELPEGWEHFDPSKGVWDYESPTGDLLIALQGDSYGDGAGTFLDVVQMTRATPFKLHDIKKVHEHHVSYHGTEWRPGDGTSSELTLVAILELQDGRWATINAWNDYTGWGCQDDSQIRIAPDRLTAIRNGLDNEGRELLGVQP